MQKESKMSDQRERDIQEVCDALISYNSYVVKDERYGDMQEFVRCFFCGSECYSDTYNFESDEDIESKKQQIEHDFDCPVLIAKDLSTNGGIKSNY
jgi:hypothetical protein